MSRLRLVPLAVLLLATAAHALSDEVKQLYQRGMAAYALGKYAEAADEYEKAFSIDPQPALLYDAAQAHRLGGNKQRALFLYQNYLRLFGDQVPNRAEVEGHIAALKEALDNDKRVSTAPPMGPAPTTPPAGEGSKTPVASLTTPASTATTTAPLPPSVTEKTTPVVVGPPPPRTEPATVNLVAPPPAERPRSHRTAIIVGVVVAAVAVIAAGVAIGVTVGGPSDPTPSLGAVRWGN